MKQSKLIVMSLCILFSGSVFALRCGQSLVDIGSYREDVIEKCGEPDSVDTHIEIRGITNRLGGRTRAAPRTSINFGQQYYSEIEVVVDEWIYDFGPRRFRYYLRFENGRLTEMKSLGKGRYH
jgi:hypothetical protein